jgi:hypothetical protein
MYRPHNLVRRGVALVKEGRKVAGPLLTMGHVSIYPFENDVDINLASERVQKPN